VPARDTSVPIRLPVDTPELMVGARRSIDDAFVSALSCRDPLDRPDERDLQALTVMSQSSSPPARGCVCHLHYLSAARTFG
jgi:hypothetical protein